MPTSGLRVQLSSVKVFTMSTEKRKDNAFDLCALGSLCRSAEWRLNTWCASSLIRLAFSWMKSWHASCELLWQSNPKGKKIRKSKWTDWQYPFLDIFGQKLCDEMASPYWSVERLLVVPNDFKWLIWFEQALWKPVSTGTQVNFVGTI